MKNFLKFQNYFPNAIAVGSLFLLLPFFFYQLGQSSLVSWDEAWYAEISRNIIKSGDIFNLSWNEMAYYDHPPVGFWLIAVSELVFGYNEFGVRSASAIVGFLAIVAIYFLGKAMFSRVVGWCSAIGLTSSFWFLFRARSGNLDVFLTFFFILTFLTAWKVREGKKWLIPFGVSLALLFLTKTGIPLTIIPALTVVFWGTKFKVKDYFSAFSLVIFIGGIWIVSQFLTNPGFFDRYLMVGLPGVGGQTSYLDNFILAKTYLHDGIGKWFWLGVAGLGSSLLIGVISLYLSLTSPLRRGDNRGGIFSGERKWLVFPIFSICFFGPFVLSAKGHIWHLIPLHPFMIISFFAAFYYIGNLILMQLKVSQYRNIIISLPLILFAIYISSFQLRSAWVQFVNQPKYVSDEQILSEEAGNQPGRFFIDDDFGPSAVWYSGGKKVGQIRDDDVFRLFNKEGKFGGVGEFSLITKQYRLDDQGIAKERYKTLKSDRDKILVVSR